MISIQKVSKWYGDVRVLTDCTTEIAKGEVVVVCGPSGSGKSTLIKCINGLEPFQQGRILVDNVSVGDRATNLPKLRARVGMVFQDFQLYPHKTALENITLAPIQVAKRDKAEAEDAALKLLRRVDLEEHARKFPAQLSGGQQQRVAIARALVNDPHVILADEPTGNLDSRTSDEIMQMLIRLNNAGKTIIMVTHENDIAAWAKRVIRMRDGKIETDEMNENRTSGGEVTSAFVSNLNSLLSEAIR
jgi:glutamate/aspartate transport system ATP-binding protein